jgi:hypothetical protein
VVRLTILIPALGRIKRLEDTLVSVLTHRPAKSQIVVVLGAPYPDPYDLRDEVCFVEAARGSGMADCLNAGLTACRGAVVNVLGCGVEVGPRWAVPALAHFRDENVAAVAPTIRDRFQPERVLSAGVGYHRGGAAWRLSDGQEIDSQTPPAGWVGPDPLAAFYRKSALDAVGGFRPQYGDDLAALDCALALCTAGYRIEREPTGAVFASLQEVHLSRRLGRGRHAERLFWDWAPRLKQSRSLCSHTALWTAELLRPAAWPHLAGRFSEIVKLPFRSRNELPSYENLSSHIPGAPHSQFPHPAPNAPLRKAS